MARAALLSRPQPGWFKYLERIADAFSPDKTRVVGFSIDMRDKSLELEFSNGYALVVHANGASRIVQREPM